MSEFFCKRRVFSLLGIGLGTIVMGLVFTMVNTTIPLIQKDLGIPLSHIQWMMLSFGMINCAFLVTSGRLADIYGRKKIFLLGLSLSGVGMVVGGMSQGIGWLIVSMCFAGIGNAILLPVSQAMLVTQFPESQKSRAVAIWASTTAYAMAVGPILAGVLSELLGWRGVFWCMIPLFITSLSFVCMYTQESKNTVDLPRIDLKGMGLLAFSLASFIFLVTEFKSVNYFVSGFLLVSSIVGFSILWKHSHIFPFPILLPAIVRKKFFLGAAMAGACLVFYVWSIYFLFPTYLQSVRHFSPMLTGVLMLGITVPLVFFSTLIGRWYAPFKAWVFISTGFLFLLASSLFQFFFSDGSSLLHILFATVLTGIGYVFICGPTATAAISIVPLYRAGVASGTFVTFQEIGGSLGLAIVVTIVRFESSLIEGIQKGTVALCLVSVLGLLCAFFLRAQKSEPLV